MKFLRPHLFWLGLMIVSVAIIAGRSPVLHFAGDRVARDLTDVKAERAKIEGELRQLRNDVASARKLGSQIDRAHADEILAPTDRLKAAVQLEKEAAAAKIARFTYTLAPEEHASIDAGGGAQNLGLSSVSLSGDVPDDMRIYDFIIQAQHLLPGRTRLQALTIARINTDAPVSSNNVHFEATLEWLSNGSLQTVAGRL